MLNIITLTLGQLETNCYLIADEATNNCLIIDPADEADQITQKILDEKLTPQAIILTHGHFDHVLGCLELKLNFKIPTYLHPLDNFLLKQAQSNAKHFLGLNVDPVPPADFPLTDDQVIDLGAEKLIVIHTPGHTPGSICLLSPPSPVILNLIQDRSRNEFGMTKNAIFTGDTLFSDAVGRTDLSYSSPSDLQNSLKNLKSTMCNVKSAMVFPGHGPSFKPGGISPHS